MITVHNKHSNQKFMVFGCPVIHWSLNLHSCVSSGQTWGMKACPDGQSGLQPSSRWTCSGCSNVENGSHKYTEKKCNIFKNTFLCHNLSTHPHLMRRTRQCSNTLSNFCKHLNKQRWCIGRAWLELSDLDPPHHPTIPISNIPRFYL
jgi:hypothetical protein